MVEATIRGRRIAVTSEVTAKKKSARLPARVPSSHRVLSLLERPLAMAALVYSSDTQVDVKKRIGNHPILGGRTGGVSQRRQHSDACE